MPKLDTAGDLDFTEEKKEEEEKEEIEELLSNLSGKGYSVHIDRSSPAWCAGFLDTWPLDEGLTLADIRDAYGGRRFKLRIIGARGKIITNRVIQIAGEPMLHGQKLHPGGVYEKGGQIVVNPPPAPETSNTDKILDALQQQQKANQDLMLKMIENKQATIDPLAQMSQMFQMMGALREFTAEVGGDKDDLSEIAKVLIKEFAERKMSKTSPTVHKETLALPRSNPKQTEKTEAPAATADEPGEELPSLVEELAEHEPEEVAAILGDVFATWPADKQQRALAAMMATKSEIDSAPATDQTIDEPQKAKEG